MSGNDIHRLSAHELIERYRSRELSPVEATEAILERIERLNPEIMAFITVTPEIALEDARRAEQAYADGDAGPLAGVPVGIKDLTLTKGVRTTMGSLLHENDVPDEDTPDAERLKAAGIVFLGKTNTPEYGWKGDSGNRLVGPTRNPWDTSKTAGGSSGGAGAALAAGMGPLMTGSDGAGSIRIPSAFCGVFGLKPTTGLVPRYPSRILPYSHVGPMARTVRDAALMLNVMAGQDLRDRYSWSPEVDFVAELEGGIEGLKATWSPDLGYAEVDPEVREIASRAARTFEDLGCDVVEAHPAAPDPWPVMETIFALSQLEAHVDDFDEVRDRLDPHRAELIEFARMLTIEDYLHAQRSWNDYYQQVRAFMNDYDLLLTPAIACPPFPAGADKPETVNGKPTTYLGWTGFAYPFNLTGQPAASIPCGFTRDGLPVGLQIAGRFREDHTVLRAAAAFEQAQPWEGLGIRE